MGRLLGAAAIAGALLAAGCGGDSASNDTTTAALPAGCHSVEAPPVKDVNLKRPGLSAPAGHPVATVQTSCGDFRIRLDPRTAPDTVASFEYLARRGVYDDTLFNQVKPGYAIQAGDPLQDGTGGPGYFVDEKPPPDTEYTRGVVAMAKTEVEPPGRSGSQFFVVVAADAALPPVYAPLGTVVAGQDVVNRIASTGSSDGSPGAPVVVDHVTVRG
jgi:peptidyl-prolyl cis-trans isomerase B (cyclophilin B)